MQVYCYLQSIDRILWCEYTYWSYFLWIITCMYGSCYFAGMADVSS